MYFFRARQITVIPVKTAVAQPRKRQTNFTCMHILVSGFCHGLHSLRTIYWSIRARSVCFVSPQTLNMTASSSSSLDRLPQDIMADILSRLPAATLLDLRRVCKPWSSLILAPSFATKHLRLRSESHQDLQLLHLPSVPPDWPVPTPDADFCSVLSSDPVSGSFSLRAKFTIPFDEHALSSEVVGSIDGLVCVSQLHKRFELRTVQSMYLWNPAMRKLRDLGNRDVVERVAGVSGYRIHGFGRDRRGRIYRVVRITYGRTRKGKKESPMEAVQVEVCTVGRDSWRMLEPHGVSCFAGPVQF